MTTEYDYKNVLKAELLKRKSNNPRYSMRAFARALRLQTSKLSEILNGKKGLSVQRAQEIVSIMQFNQIQADLFCLSVECQHARSPRKKDRAKIELDKMIQNELSVTFLS